MLNKYYFALMLSFTVYALYKYDRKDRNREWRDNNRKTTDNGNQRCNIKGLKGKQQSTFNNIDNDHDGT